MYAIRSYYEPKYSSSSSHSDNGCGEACGSFFAEMFIYSLIYAQSATLEGEDQFQERSSIDINGFYGIDPKNTDSYHTGQIRANWGILATDFRYSNLSDVSGYLENLDWQILVLRAPIGPLKLEYGLGFTQAISPSVKWFESSAGFELGLNKNQYIIKSHYRWTEMGNTNRFRKEFNVAFHYRVLQSGRFHFYPVLKYANRIYYDDYKLNFFEVGLLVSLQ